MQYTLGTTLAIFGLIFISVIVLIVITKVIKKEINLTKSNIGKIACSLVGICFVIGGILELVQFEQCSVGLDCTAEQARWKKNYNYEQALEFFGTALFWFGGAFFLFFLDNSSSGKSNINE